MTIDKNPQKLEYRKLIHIHNNNSKCNSSSTSIRESKESQWIKRGRSIFRIFNTFSFYIYCITIAVVLYLIIHNTLVIHKRAIVQVVQDLDKQTSKNSSFYNFNSVGNNNRKVVSGESEKSIFRQSQQEENSQTRIQSVRYLRFSVCNGFTNQRLGIVFGIIMAKELDRFFIIPKVLTDGVQKKVDNVAANEDNTKPLGAWHDIDVFIDFLERNDVRYVMQDPNSDAYTVASCDGMQATKCLQHLKTEHATDAKLHFECPFPNISLSKKDILKNAQLFLQALENLQPNTKFQQMIEKGQSRLEFLSGRKEYNFLHVRMEVDWIAHCQRWQAIQDGRVRDNCFTDTFSLGEHLVSKGVELDIPLYVATDWNLVDTRIKDAVLDPLKNAGYETITQTSVLNDLVVDLKREELGLKDYYLALGANKFIGNSVSTFSALVILERRSQGLWSAYYNGGAIPLSVIVPLYKLPWVFTYNSWSTPLDYLTKAAVKSAKAKANLKPYCMFTGDKNSSIYQWLESEGVEMIIHRPQWIIKLTEINTKSADYTKTHSHLYANSEGIAGTFQRIDIPILEQLKQYDYVFYTDTDVFFRGEVSLDAFPYPLPKAVGMGPEMADAFPYNAGVALWNNHVLRKSHDSLVNFILNSSDALYWKDYGPVDQGALNKFYEEDIRNWKLPVKFNTKPYHLYSEDSLIVHFHGPKPHHYLEYLQKGTCGKQLYFGFGKLCELGVKNGLCFYIVEDWYRYVKNEPVAKQLYLECKAAIEKQVNKNQESLSDQQQVSLPQK